MGFLAVWCQFAMTIFYYPSLLGFVASTLAYVFNPELASSGVWTAAVIIVVYWSGVWVSSRGTKGVAGLASGGLIIGTLIPGTVLVLLGVVFLGQGNESAAPMTADNIFPVWAGLASLVLIVNNFLSYSGMEMNAVHVSSLKNPAKEFPKAMFLAMGLVLRSSSCPRWPSAGSSPPRSCRSPPASCRRSTRCSPTSAGSGSPRSSGSCWSPRPSAACSPGSPARRRACC